MFLDGYSGDITGPVKEMNLELEHLYETGSVLNSIGAQRTIDIQSDYLSKSRNKIPLIFMQDVIHGYRTIYPINLGLSCSFDTSLARECAQMAAKEAAVDGIHVTFAPMLDLARDARWGRVMESSVVPTILGWRRPGKIGTCQLSSIAQSVEHLTVNQGVTGSSPVGGVKQADQYAPLAQLVEQLTLNQWVPGSNP